MSSSIALEEQDWIDCSLKQYERQKCISRFRKMVCEPLDGKGKNHYGSDVFKIKAEVVLNNGEIENKNYIFKSMPRTKSRRHFSKTTRSFVKEGAVYKEVIPEMKRLMKETGMTFEYLWPKCFAVRPRNEGFLFEDLSVEGYIMANRQTGLDYDQACLAIRAIAKYHALSAVLREKEQLDTFDFPPTLTQDMVEVATDFNKKNLNDLIKIMKDDWKGEWIEYANLLSNMLDSMTQNIVDGFKLDEQYFCVLNHGDLTLGNMLFRYSDGKPISIKLFDFQLSFYNRPGYDLQYLFQTSLSPEVRKCQADLLLLYHELLSKHLSSLGYHGEIPTIDEITNGYQWAKLYGLAAGLSTIPFLMADVNVDMESFTKTLNENDQKSLSLYSVASDTMIQCLKHTIREALGGLIQNS